MNGTGHQQPLVMVLEAVTPCPWWQTHPEQSWCPVTQERTSGEQMAAAGSKATPSILKDRPPNTGTEVHSLVSHRYFQARAHTPASV